MLIYSDPPKTATRRARVSPNRTVGPETHLQRGLDHVRLTSCRGPAHARNGASTEGARRITPEEAQSVPKIMAAVMSWHDSEASASSNMDRPRRRIMGQTPSRGKFFRKGVPATEPASIDVVMRQRQVIATRNTNHIPGDCELCRASRVC